MSSPIQTESAKAAEEAVTQEQQSQQTEQPQQQQQQQQQEPIAATTSSGLTAPKPKVDHSSTDATIQGLLVQVIALQHNKIQQIQSSSQDQA